MLTVFTNRSSLPNTDEFRPDNFSTVSTHLVSDLKPIADDLARFTLDLAPVAPDLSTLSSDLALGASDSDASVLTSASTNSTSSFLPPDLGCIASGPNPHNFDLIFPKFDLTFYKSDLQTA